MILTGWKKIAAHLGYGVRTVQRWQRIGLPVKRVTKGVKSPVVADSDELDAWLLRLPIVRGSVDQGLRANLRGAGVEFLRTEIRLGVTRSEIALEAAHGHKRERNRASARQAYDTAIRLIPKLALTSEEAGEIKPRLAQLELALRQLGEKL